MNDRKEFTNILNDCLDRILVKGESIEQCLRSYPALASELEPLLKTALFTHRASAIAPRPEFRERARYQFQAALRDMAAKKEKRRFFSFGAMPRFATVAISIVLALVVAGGGTVAAAGNSLPDNPMYAVKLATEAVQLRLADTPLEKAELYAKFADKRVAELVKMAEKGKPEQVQKIAERLNDQLTKIATNAKANGEAVAMLAAEQAPAAAPAPSPRLAVAPAPEPTTDAAAGVAPAAAEPAPVTTPKPAPTAAPKPVPAPAITPKKPVPSPEAPTAVAPKKVAPDITAKKAPAPTVEKEPAALSPTPPTKTPQPLDPETRAKLQKRAQLKEAIAKKSLTNPEAIREAIKNAPESVKPFLEQALNAADSGYEQALEALEK